MGVDKKTGEKVPVGKRIFLGMTHGLNMILGGNYWQPLSSRLWEAWGILGYWWWYPVFRMVDGGLFKKQRSEDDRGHCEISYHATLPHRTYGQGWLGFARRLVGPSIIFLLLKYNGVV